MIWGLKLWEGMEKFDGYINGVSTNYGSLVVPVSRG